MLFEWDGSRYTQLSNEGGRDVLRLYQWLLLMPDGEATDVLTPSCEQLISDESFSCVCLAGRNSWRGRQIRFESSRCPDFLWTNGPSRFWDEETGEVLLRVEVLEYGREPDLLPLPLVP